MLMQALLLWRDGYESEKNIFFVVLRCMNIMINILAGVPVIESGNQNIGL